jgi:NAD(P)-dependent dehydrogenase (short-subunit alcohol dehydrogenase family)/acyl carrier protein
VDSIKRVEILSALQDRLPDAPPVKPEHLGRLHSLQDVAQFLAGPGDALLPAPSSNGAKPFPIPEPPVTVATPVIASEPVSLELLDSALSSMKSTETKPKVETRISGTSSKPPVPHHKEHVEQVLLEVVSEKTGYPVGMLNLGMTLDSDLGVDSIKRVEILSALQDRLPDAPPVKPEHLGRLHSLQDVAQFLAATHSELTPKTEQVETIRIAAVPDSAFAVKPASPPPSAETVSFGPKTTRTEGGLTTLRPTVTLTSAEKIDRSILQVVDLDLTVSRPRLPLAERSEVWVVAPPDDPFTHELTSLLSQQFAVRSWNWVDPAIPMANGNPAGLVLVAPVKAMPNLNRLAIRWLQQAGAKIRLAARTGTGLIASVTRLDGGFGLADLSTQSDPTVGGLAGLVKTVRHEWPEVSVKALDLNPAFASSGPPQAAAAVMEELLLIGPTEVGISATHRVGLEPVRTVRKASSSGTALFGPKDVILVSGGARGVTAEAAVALAQAFHSTLVLFGRTPIPTGAEAAWSAGITDETALKNAAARHLGATATPKAVSELVQRTLAQRDIRATLGRIEAAGGRAMYLTGDVADPHQMADLLHQTQVKAGPVTGLIHGAGVLADRRIEELTGDQFETVYSTKVTGLRTLLDLLSGQELKALILFSSTTARLGRTGQLAYAMANEVLNKMAQVESRRRPNCRVVAINWGPWDGGMVTPALKRIFEGEGVGLIPLDEGGTFVVQELSAPGRAVEVIALGKVRSGIKSDSSVVPASAAVRPGSGAVPNPIVRSVVPPPLTNFPAAAELSLVFERAVDLPTHPVLRSHVIDGRAVLPMALHMEWLAHAALHGNPGLVFHGFNEMRVTNGVMLEDGATSTVRVYAGKAVKRDSGLFHAPVELRGKRRDGRDVIHSRGEVVLTASLPKAPLFDRTPEVQPYPHPLDEIYRYFLFHGADLHGIERVEGMAEAAFVGTAYPAPTPGEWMTSPLRGGWVMDPLVLDTSFQMMILWSYAQHGAGSLPCFAGRYRQYRRAFPAGPVRVVVRVTRDNGSFARADIDYLDPMDGNVIAQIQDYECVIDPQLNQAFRRNQLLPKVKV